MAKNQKYDGVIDAVHYDTNGKVKWVRAYERRGPTWSDYVLIHRDDLINKITDGKVFMAGRRIPQMGSTFDVSVPVNLVQVDHESILVSGDSSSAETDTLAHIPVV